MKKHNMEMWEKMEYKLFANWWKDYPDLRNPNTAITLSLARQIARLVYEKIKDENNKNTRT